MYVNNKNKSELDQNESVTNNHQQIGVANALARKKHSFKIEGVFSCLILEMQSNDALVLAMLVTIIVTAC